jgi:hypothetical protein
VYRCKKRRQPVSVDLTVSIKKDDHCAPGLSGSSVLAADKSGPLVIANQPHLALPLSGYNPTLKLRSYTQDNGGSILAL